MKLDLTLSVQQSLAKKIRSTIEPNGAKRSEELISEIELRKLILEETGIHIDGTGDIVSILESNYNEKTISRLLSKIKRSIVWDASMCRLPTQEFLELLTETETHIITSLSFFEFYNLCKEPNNDHIQYENAKYIIYSVLDDSASSKFIYVFIKKNGYVDRQLLQFCSQNNYHLYTRDLHLGLIARCYDFGVTIFNKPTRDKSPVDYTPNLEGKNFILSTDLLQYVTIQDIISVAENFGYNKIIVTYDFVNELEKEKEKYIKFSLFLLYNEEVSIYLDPDESKKSLIELSKKYNATIFTANIVETLKYKQSYVDYKFIKNTATRNFITDFTKKHINIEIDSDSTSDNLSTPKNATAQKDLQPFDEKIAQTQNSKDKPFNLNETPNIYRQLPHLLRNGGLKPLTSLPFTEKIWVLDKNNVELNTENSIYPKKDYTIIHGKNTLMGNYVLEVYIVTSNTKNGNLIFRTTFTKETVKLIDPKYKDYATRLVLLT